MLTRPGVIGDSAIKAHLLRAELLREPLFSRQRSEFLD
jgi:hypothetical protein